MQKQRDSLLIRVKGSHRMEEQGPNVRVRYNKHHYMSYLLRMANCLPNV